jgi:predicted AAA+ superfamily ATPase
LEQVIDDLLDAGWPAPNLTYFDFSDDRLVEDVTARDVAETEPMGLDPSRPRIFLLDEISQALRWDRWLKQAVDKGIGRIVVTDSAASVLREGARESGQGRWDEVRIEGLSFGEFFRIHQGVEQPAGLGSPPPAAPPNVLERDLAGRVDDPGRVRDFFVYLVQESGAEYVATHRANDLARDRRTVDGWLRRLEDTFLLRDLEQRREKASKRLRSRPKVYAADHGLVMAFAASADPVNDPEVRAKVFEAVVYRHLREIGAPLTYLRISDDLESDFALDTPAGPVLVETTQSRSVRARKTERLRELAERVGAVHSVVIHGGLIEATPEERAADQPVSMPLSRFLLNPAGVLAEEA